ncbi:MAG: tetratricopeptide repeat protein [Alphaproteobacteria bacterium]|nr:tetratricopeptide repeat protein [Alphaproteobacteria bacterium]MDP6813942.1 tetratricopeptide repeat protein [Alphaproteobacteria bacterium]
MIRPRPPVAALTAGVVAVALVFVATGAIAARLTPERHAPTEEEKKSDFPWLQPLQLQDDWASETLRHIISLLVDGKRKAAREAVEKFLNANPDHATALEILGTMELGDGRLKKAEAILRRSLELTPSSNSATAKLGVVRLRRGDAAGGRALLHRALSNDPTHLYALMHLARLETGLGNTGAALSYYRQMLAAQPDGGRVLTPFHIELADLYNRIGRFGQTKRLLLGRLTDKLPEPARIAGLRVAVAASIGLKDAATAERDLRRLGKLLPANDRRRVVLESRVANLKGDYPGAVATLEKARRETPKSALQFNVELARLHTTNGQPEPAAKAYQAAIASMAPDANVVPLIREYVAGLVEAGSVKDAESSLLAYIKRFPERPRIAVMLASFQAGRGDTKGALARLQGLEGNHPELAEVQELKARLLFSRGRSKDAFVAMQKAARLDPANIDYWISLSDLAHKVGGHEAVAPVLREGLAANPGHPDLLYDMALIDDEEGRKTAATRRFQAILKTRPDHVPTLISLSTNLAEAKRTAGAARQHIAHALQLRPDDPRVRSAYGWVLHRTGDNRAALAILQSLADAGSKDPIVHYRMARVHQALKQTDQARKSAKKALSMGYQGAGAEDLKAMLR